MDKMKMGAAKAVVKSQINKAIEATGGDSTYSMTLNFKADGTWSSQTNFPMAKGEKTGIWKVISDSENEMVISCVWTDSKTGKSDSTRTTIRFVKPEQIKLAPPNMNGLDLELTFDRQSAK